MPSRLEQSIILPTSKCPALVAHNSSSNLAVVVTHPWGFLGGDMHNNIVLAVVLFFQKYNITTLRFDFMGSQLGSGTKQMMQIQEAAEYLLHNHENKSTRYILLVGYSYGSLLAASASASIPACIGYISIAPAWAVQHWLLLFHSQHHLTRSASRTHLPKLFVLGDCDNFTPEHHFQRTMQNWYGPSTGCTSSTGAILKNADHFFRKREKDVMSIIGQWLLQTYPQVEGKLSNLRKVEYQDSSHLVLQAAVLSKSASNDAAAATSSGLCGGICATSNGAE